MVKNNVKKLSSIFSIVLILCLFAQVMPHNVLGTAEQEPVTKDGEQYVDVTTYTGNSGTILGDKVTANDAIYEIMFEDTFVGSFVFTKNSPYIKISIEDYVDVDVTWNCGTKYASCTLSDEGLYMLPQLLQDNGKTQNFNAIWVTNIKPSSYIPPPPSNNISSDHKSGQIIHKNGDVLGKYGAQIAYNNKQSSENDQRFYPSMVVVVSEPIMFIDQMEISVTGTRPDGSRISTNEFLSPTHSISPQPTGEDWKNALADIINTISAIPPLDSINAGVTKGQGVSGNLFDGYYIQTGTSGGTVRTIYNTYRPINTALDRERGYQFGVTLNCDTDLPGIYTINVHYRIKLASQVSVALDTTTVEFDQQVTLEYQPPPRAYATSVKSTWTTPNSNAGVYYSNDITGSTINDNYAQLYSGSSGNKAIITVQLNKSIYSGHVYIYGRSIASDRSHIYVYVSNDNTNWQEINNFRWGQNSPNEPHYIDCNYGNGNFIYIMIVAINDTGYLSAVQINAVHVYY